MAFQLIAEVNELKTYLDTEQVAEIESPRAFSELLPAFRQASKEKIVRVLKTNDKIM